MKDTLLESIKKDHDALLDEAKEIGQQDGGLNIPDANATAPSPYEKKLRSQYQSIINRVGADRDKEMSSISYEKISSLRKERDSVTQEDIEASVATINEREADLIAKEKENHVKKVTETNSNAKFKSTQAKKNVATKEFKRLAEREGRTWTNKTVSNNFIYFFILSFIGLAELAVNYQTFIQFKKNLIITFVMALSFVIVPIIAHFVGGMIKQWRRNRKKASYTIVPIAGTTLVTVMFYYVATLSTAGKATDAETSLWIFFILSMLLYLGGVLLAHAHVDSCDSFYRAFLEMEKADKEFEKQEKIRSEQLERYEKAHSKELESIRDTYDGKRHAAKNIVSGKGEAINAIISQYNEAVSLYRKIEDQVNSFYNEAVQQYRMVNLIYNPTPAPPAWDEEIPSLKLNEIKFEKED